MQEKISLPVTNSNAFETALTKQRLSRYMPTAGYNIDKAINIYLWNSALCESSIMPLHIAEVVCRNSIQKTLRVRLKSPWYEQEQFLKLLDAKQRDHLLSVVSDERTQHQRRMNDDHIVSSLHFGFWDHLTTKRFDRLLWLRGIKNNFPNAYAKNLTIRNINERIQTVRQWRNRVAHHGAIFDKDPEKKFNEAVTLIEWTCEETANWVRTHSTLMDVIKRGPVHKPPAAGTG